MSSNLIIGLELSLVLGVALAIGFWELWSLRRDRRRQPKDGNRAPPAGS